MILKRIQTDDAIFLRAYHESDTACDATSGQVTISDVGGGVLMITASGAVSVIRCQSVQTAETVAEWLALQLGPLHAQATAMAQALDSEVRR